MIAKIRSLINGGLAKDTAFVGFWQAIRLGCLGLWVLIIARVLGPSGYGSFVGIAGLATTLGGLTGLGLGLMMLQDAARDPNLFDDRWRKASIGTSASGLLLGTIFTLSVPILLNPSASVVVLAAMACSELLCFPWINLSAFAFSAHHRMGTAAALPALTALARLLAALVCWLTVTHATLDSYVMFHVSASILCAIAAWWWVRRQLRPKRVAFGLSYRDTTEGLGFSLMWIVSNALTSLDKTLVLRLAGPEIAGLYGVIYRLASVLTMPIDALTMAAGPRLFRHGGGKPQPGLVTGLFGATLAYSALAALAIWLTAPLLPWLLGQAFVPAAGAAHGMALFAPCYGLRLLGSNILMGGDRKRLRIIIEAAGLIALLGLAPPLLSRYGLRGAVIMICSTEALLALAAWTAIAMRPPKMPKPHTKYPS